MKSNNSPPKSRQFHPFDGGLGLIQEDDRDAGGDGGGQGAAGVQRPVRPSPHPPQQMPAGGDVLSMEVRPRAPLLREVRVRARHGADAADAEDP